jgi:pimeloyl-ACP methyl ester carboxylesterase
MPEMLTRGISIEYDVHGDGPPLILIGGLGFGRWSWFKQVPALSNRFRTIAFDVRGEQSLSYGVADLSAEVVTLLDHLGIEKAHVLGTSLGGFVAQELALERPDLVDKLVLVCTSYGSHAPETMSPQALGRMLGWGALSPESATRRGLETATSDAYRDENPDEFNLILRWRLADSPSLATYYQQAMAGARFDASHDVENIASPTLVIHGADDRYMPVANAVALAESIPGAKLRVFEDAGHLVFIERAEEVNEEIVSFLEPREEQKPQEPPTPRRARKLIERARKRGAALGRVSGWLRRSPRRSPRIPVDWARKLRGRLSR